MNGRGTSEGGEGRKQLLALLPGFLLLFALEGCRLIGGAAPGTGQSAPGAGEVPGGTVYQGSLTLEGGDIPGALELTPMGRRDVRGALQTSSGVLADGEGRVRGGILTLDLVYDGDCPGRMVLEGTWNREAGVYQGTVEATDCTGGGRGTFRFTAH